jgi:hypothetical protein
MRTCQLVCGVFPRCQEQSPKAVFIPGTARFAIAVVPLSERSIQVACSLPWLCSLSVIDGINAITRGASGLDSIQRTQRGLRGVRLLRCRINPHDAIQQRARIFIPCTGALKCFAKSRAPAQWCPWDNPQR